MDKQQATAILTQVATNYVTDKRTTIQSMDKELQLIVSAIQAVTAEEEKKPKAAKAKAKK